MWKSANPRAPCSRFYRNGKPQPRPPHGLAQRGDGRSHGLQAVEHVAEKTGFSPGDATPPKEIPRLERARLQPCRTARTKIGALAPEGSANVGPGRPALTSPSVHRDRPSLRAPRE